MASFTDYTKEYLKKKKKEAEKLSFTEYTQLVTNTSNDDIAPVKPEKEEGKWFKKGAFEDGYDTGDVTKSILGTAGDAGINIVKGATGLVEGVADLLNYGVAGIGDLIGADEEADRLREKTKKSWVDENFSPVENVVDQNSFFGETMDSVAQGVGQVGAIILTGGLAGAAGASSAAATALTTGMMGVSSWGSGMSEAYQNGATNGEAWAYGAMKGIVDAGTELIFGGLGKSVNALGLSKGISSLDDVFAKKLSSKISNQFWKNATEYGVKASAEGVEEVLAGYGSAIAKKLTYMSDEELQQLVEDEDLLEQFVVGTVVSGIAQGGDLVKSTKQGRDFVTGTTSNEDLVVEKEVENRTEAKKKEEGRDLTKKEINEIYDEVVEDLKKGYISTNTIESVLGGETYKTYKDTVDSENALVDQKNALQEEFNTLNKMKQGEMTGEQIDRREDLRSQIKELTAKIEETQKNSQRSQLKAQLSEEVQKQLVRESKSGKKIADNYLVESYNERARTSQKFEADVSKYEGKARETIQSIIDKGHVNNTRRAHETWDWLANVSADKNIKITSTTTEEILEMERTKHGDEYVKKNFAGKTPNAYVLDDGTIALNVDSPQYSRFFVGHEITHTLEKTEHYGDLQKLLFAYAEAKKGKEGFESQKKNTKDLYKGIKGAKVKKEITADLVGEYIYSDADFVKHLSTKNRNLFLKIFDEVKYLYKMATAGSREQRDLLRIKRTFEKVYRESVNTESKANGEKKFSLSETTDGRFVAVVDDDILSNIDTNSWDKAKKDEAKKAASDALKKFNDGIVVDGITRKVNRVSRREYTRSNDTERLYRNAPSVFADKMRAADVVDDIVVATTNWNRDGGLKHPRDDNFVDFDHGKTLIMSGDAKYNAEVVIGITDKGDAVFYDVVDMTPTTFDIKKESPTTATTQNAIGDIQGDSSAPIISQNSEKSSGNEKFSLSAEQQEYFKDSVVRDENGELKVMYHGTSKGGHTVFDTYGSNYGLFGQGSYFTDNKDVAESYTKKGKGNNPQVYESYLNITNPMDMDAEADPKAWAKAFPYATFPESGTNEDFYRAMEEYFEDEQYSKWEAAEEAMESLMGMGYDGITHIGGGRFNKADDTRHRVYIAFNPEQIKNIDNVKPTDNPDIRYSLTQDSEGTKLTAEQSDFFKDTKALDSNGNLLKVYHTTKNDFTVFDKSKKGDATGDSNTYLGFFFADDSEYMQNFPEFENGKTEAYYLNMTNPIDMTNISKEAFIDVVEVLGGDVQEAAEIYDQELSDEKDRAMLRGDNNTSLQLIDLLNEMTGDADYRTFIEELKPHYDELMSKGYDGVVNYLDELFGTKEYIVLDSNQAKLVSNLKPTSDPDIRYSISTERIPMAKTVDTDKPTMANLQKDLKTVRNVRTETMLKNGYTAEDVEKVNHFMDNLATFMEKAGVTYKFIGLEDVNNAKLKVTYDKNGNPKKITVSAMVKNGEYPVNFDFTRICKKRESMSMVIKELAQRKTSDGRRTIDTIDLNAEALWTINEELRKAGLETACLGCFVESKRYNIQAFADKAVKMWNSIVDEVRQENGALDEAESFNFAEGIDLDRVDYGAIEKIFADYNSVKGRTSPEARMRALIRNGGDLYQRYLQPSDLMTPEGIESIKALSTKQNDFYGILKGVYGQAAPKEVTGFSPYNSEVALLPKKKNGKELSEYVASIGGVRMQSFSDFLVANVYDYMQMVADLSARHLPAHAYTKEIAFAKIFGMTGIKINMSVMFDIDANLPGEYAGLQFVADENGDEYYNGVKGRWDYLVGDKNRSDSVYEATGERPYVQSIGFDEAVALQSDPRYSKNCGIIGVGMSDRHILKMLDDGRIRYIIPYHSSSLPAVIAEVTNIKLATDYTTFQNTRKIDSITDANGNAVDLKSLRERCNSWSEVYSLLQENVALAGWNVETESDDKLAGRGGFDIYKDVESTKNPKQSAENYLQYCAENNYMPVFEQFAFHENYYKLLYDFDPYDSVTGEYSPQTEVKNIYSGYNPSEGFTSTETVEKIINDEMAKQNEINKARNDVMPGVVDNVLEQLGVDHNEVGVSTGDEQLSLSREGEASVRFNDDVPMSDLRLKTAPTREDIVPVREDVSKTETFTEDFAPTKEYEAIKPRPEKLTGEEAQWAKNKMSRVDKVNVEEHHTAEILDAEPETAQKKSRGWSRFRANFLDKHSVFEDLALKTKNRELMGKANHMLSSESRAQWMIGNGTDGVKSLNDIRKEVESTGLTKQFYEYMYHKHNIDRMNLEGRYKDTENKPVFGYDVTAEASQEIVNQYEFAEPKFKEYAEDVYKYMNHLRKQLVDNGVISQETADLWAEMYPHYVPIRRLGDSGLNINVPLDTGRTGVNAPIKKATGGSRDILPLFDTMAMRTEQTYKAIAKNSFGVELKNTLGTTIESNATNLDEVIDSIDKHDELLKKGENGRRPTFTVFENGERVTFEITEDMYDALKPTSEGLAYTNKALNTVNNVRRGLITEYNPVFLLTNVIKDAQDVLMNSQHAGKTYKNFPKAIKELATKGKWYKEYMEAGGEQNTYFDGKTNSFTKDDTGIKKIIGIPLNGISKANNFIERMPRLAEYIASRESGASVEVSMLDAARVTTNFAAGGDVTKFLNRNGATFLNASVQGAMQQVRNVREAKANGLKGWIQLAAKTAIAGLPALILNNLLWDDDEEYEELSDYVKDNYYVVAKYGDGQFVRIPKGRTVAVIQDAFEQVSNALTGDDEIDLANFLELAISNLAPNNPIDNNIISPIIQAAQNKTWYGEDLVPTRLQDLPAREQYDESTDAISKWLGETLNVSPIKLNYLLDQYSGGLGDVFLPMLTPEAERGDNTLVGNVIAPFKDKFTTDSTMNNQNVSDFYDTMDELTINAKASTATDEDILKYKYFNSVSSEIGELYALKREIQNSDLPDDRKYAKVREIQDEINAYARESLNSYGNVLIDGEYAVVGDRYYRLNDKGEWQKITTKQYAKQEDVTEELGISASDYWSDKSEYDFAYEHPEKYAVAKAIGGYDSYKAYTSELYDIKADKDSNGKSISGSRKEKVIEYINNLEGADYGERIILFKSEYPADDTYNYEIVEYLNSRKDLSYKDIETILKELGFTVLSDGTVQW